jgi:phospholipase C
MKITRRRFIQGAAAISGTALLAPKLGRAKSPKNCAIEHVVVLMMENRSFDHYLGWLPNADGRQAGLTYFDSNGVPHNTTPWAPDWTGCGHPDPDHSYSGGRVQYNGGAMDGFLRSGQNDVFSIGYYVEADRPFYSALARNYTALDRYFCSILGPTFPNRIFMHSAQTDRLSNTLDISTLPTNSQLICSVGAG